MGTEYIPDHQATVTLDTIREARRGWLMPWSRFRPGEADRWEDVKWSTRLARLAAAWVIGVCSGRPVEIRSESFRPPWETGPKWTDIDRSWGTLYTLYTNQMGPPGTPTDPWILFKLPPGTLRVGLTLRGPRGGLREVVALSWERDFETWLNSDNRPGEPPYLGCRTVWWVPPDAAPRRHGNRRGTGLPDWLAWSTRATVVRPGEGEVAPWL